MDTTDLRLLDLLQRDAARSNQALAEAAHVSPATSLRRVRQLVDGGVIERQVAVLSPAHLGELQTAVIEVTLDQQSAERLDAFEARAVADEAVQQCYRVAGGPDFVLVVVARDMPAYQAMTQRLLTADANVRNVRAFFAVKRAKFTIALPLPTASP